MTRHGALTRRQAAALGAERMAVRRLVDRGALREPAPGVLVIAGSPDTWQQRVYVATLAGGEGSLAIGASAARLHRLDGIECAGLARTVCDVAPMGADVIERVIDDVQRRGHSTIWIAQTAARLRVSGREGIAAVEAELERRRTDSALRGSWFEKLVEECLRSPLLPGLVRQHEIRDSAGNLLARADLAVPSVRLAIEAHSRKHHTGPGAEAFDEQRENVAIAEGWLFQYVGWYHATRTPAAVCRLIEQVVARRALDLGVDLGAGS